MIQDICYQGGVETGLRTTGRGLVKELGWSGSSPGEGRLRRAGGWEQTWTHPNILGGKGARNSQAGRREARGEDSQKEGVDDSGEGFGETRSGQG